MTPELLYACGRKLGQQVLELEERNRALMSQNRGLISQISQMESAHHSEHVALEGFCQRNVQLETELAHAHETIRRQQHTTPERWRLRAGDLEKTLNEERGDAAALRGKTRALEEEVNRLREQVTQNLRSPIGGSHPGYRALNFVPWEKHPLTIEEILSQHYADTVGWMAKSREQEEELRELFRPWPELDVKPTPVLLRLMVAKKHIARFRVGGKFARIPPSLLDGDCTQEPTRKARRSAPVQ